MRVSTVLFDAGGVLIRPSGSGLADVLRECAGVRVDAATAARSYAVTDHAAHRLDVTDPVEWATLWAASMGLPAEPVIRLFRRVVRDDALGDRIWCRVEPDVRGTLDRLRGLGWRTGVVSQADGLLLRRLTGHGLADAFDVVVDSALVPFDKPQAEIYRHAAELLDVPVGECVYLSDQVFDSGGAQRAGCRWSALFDPFDVWHDSELPRFSSLTEFADAAISAFGTGLGTGGQGAVRPA